MQKLIEYFGSQTGIAKALGINRSAVSQWLKNGIPPKRAIEIEILTNGKLKASALI